jgi:hypothetical protein
MANRTIQFFGQGYAPTGTDPITISATLAGNVVYTGTIPTAYTSEINHLSDAQVVLFTCEVPMNFSGTVPMSISLDSPVGVTAFFEQTLANYATVYNPVYSTTDIEVLQNPASTQAEKTAIFIEKAVPPLNAAEIAIFETGTAEEKNAVRVAHNLQLLESSGPDNFVLLAGSAEPRTNVVINGVSQTRQSEPTGTWGWVVSFTAEESGLFDCDLTVLAGQE